MASDGSPVRAPSVGRRYWRYFLPVWLFPAIVYASNFIPEGNWKVLLFAAFFCVFFVGAIPFFRGDITITEAWWWVALVPFLIWASLFGVGWTLQRLGTW